MPIRSEDSLVRGKLVKAYQRLVKNDFDLFTADVNERSITHKLAEYIQDEFSEYHVDCEYNRKGIDPKRLSFSVDTIQSDDTEAKTAYPDIIVHHRRTSNNFIVIEAKKDTNGAVNRDLEKLRAYKDELGYQFAYFIKFPINSILENLSPDSINQLVKEIDEIVRTS